MANWLSGYERPNGKRSGAPYREPHSPHRFVLHCTDVYSSNIRYSAANHNFPPHLWVSAPSHPWQPRQKFQIISLDLSAYALLHQTGDPETNHMNAVQVEIDLKASDTYHLSDEDYEWLANELVGPVCDAWNVDLNWTVQTYGVNEAYGESARSRMDWGQWERFGGICAHQNVPGNHHWDLPIDIARLCRLVDSGSNIRPPEEVNVSRTAMETNAEDRMERFWVDDEGYVTLQWELAPNSGRYSAFGVRVLPMPTNDRGERIAFTDVETRRSNSGDVKVIASHRLFPAFAWEWWQTHDDRGVHWHGPKSTT